MTSLPNVNISVSAKALPPLRRVDASDIGQLTPPSLLIRTDEDVERWKSTRGYADYALFLRRLNESVVGHLLPENAVADSQHGSEAVQATIALLDELDRWIDDIPPQPTPQRFGNLAFRTWGQRLEERAEHLLSTLLPASLSGAVPLLLPYLLTSFGSFTRIDYGTGHETSFALFLLGLSLIRFYAIDSQTETRDASELPSAASLSSSRLLPPQPEERAIVLRIFLRYLKLCWRLQDVYRLEPAGSHGVWGLDDYHFLGYIFGSAQIRDQVDVPVSAVLRPPLPPTNLYFMQITRIHALKTGPFHEHSSQLYAIATGVPHWAKANQGLLKMYDAEVLGKRVVVQHLPLSGLLEWTPGPPSISAAAPRGTEAGTAAVQHPARVPWAQSAGPSMVPAADPVGAPSTAPWAAGMRFPTAQVGSGAIQASPQGTVPRAALSDTLALPPPNPRAVRRRPAQ